ncbi:MAG: AraC family transcriptional regulator [Lentisphaeraceae bacterium]|nr:AraC family transcriptional regulator [Lentisphaeraceae bacterium]
MNSEEIKEKFYSRLSSNNRFDLLLPASSGVYSFIKDREGLIIAANQLTYERCGCRSESEVIGKTDFDFFPKDMAEKYVKDDLRVMETGTPIINMPELAPNKEGVIQCYITNKMPLYDNGGEIIGIAGTTTSVEYFHDALKPYLTIAPTIEFIKENYRETISIPELAEMVGLKIRKFENLFKEIFQITPQTYIIKMRIHDACQKLTTTDMSIADIATSVGFYDHSTFTRQFNKHMEIKPVKYRKKYRS